MAEKLPEIGDQLDELHDVSEACAHLEAAYEALHKARWLLEDHGVDQPRLRMLATESLAARNEAMKTWRALKATIARQVKPQ